MFQKLDFLTIDKIFPAENNIHSSLLFPFHKKIRHIGLNSYSKYVYMCIEKNVSFVKLKKVIKHKYV